ncbi:hypothetical protein [Candidatus Laterigemmans baculatus]|nr:hypothetical protein [Candidatus Laterigemmans baculatus]
MLLHRRSWSSLGIGGLMLWAVGFLWAGASPAWAQELRQLEGRYVRIVTDIRSTPAIDELPRAFDAAVPLWCQFWELPAAEVEDWRVTAYLMSDRELFRERGLIPDSLPDFPHGYQWGDSAWVQQQPSDYYTRHLLLHEGAHALASHAFSGAGPPWFMEGTAELLSTHRWDGERMELPIVPESKEAFPYWGRFKLLDQRRQTGGTLSLVSVLRYSDTSHRQVEPYAWTWAAAILFEMYPEYRTALLAAAREGRDATPNFTRQFVAALGDQWKVAQARWRVLIDGLDYGYEWDRHRLEIAADDPLWDGRPVERVVAADRGWQSVGVRIPAGTRIAIAADGECVIGREPKPWITEPEGVTVRYHRGWPRGRLLATLLPTAPVSDPKLEPLEVVGIGRQGELTATNESWLLLRVADEVGELADNSGGFGVTLRGGE